LKYFDLAINLDSHFSVGAYVGKAYILLKGQVSLVLSDQHEEGYKLNALELFLKAMHILQEEMAILQVQQMLVQQASSSKLSPTGGMDCPLFHQLTDKTNLLGSYIKTVETCITIIKKSLRRVHCAAVDHDDAHCQEMRLPIGSRKISKPSEMGNAAYNLTFHDLTSFEDGGVTHDQAIDTLAFENFKESIRKRGKAVVAFLTGAEGEKKDLKKFPIGVSCPNVNVAEIGNELVNAKISFDGSRKQRVNMELLELPLDRVDRKLDFKALHAELKPKSYSMEVLVGFSLPVTGKTDGCEDSVGCWHELLALLTSEDLLGCSIKLSVALSNPKICDGIEILKLSETFHEVSGRDIRRRQLSQFQNQFAGVLLESVRCFCLKSSAIMEVMCKRFVKIQPPQNPWTFNLTMECLDGKPENWSHVWTPYLQDLPKGVCLHFENLTEKDARCLIPIMRSKHVEFQLTCQKLNFDTAEFILGKANLTQEHILQSEVKELLNLFMSDCLPLMEVLELSARGISVLATFNEKKFVPWISIASIAGLAALQAAAGGLLICTGFGATVGMGLITEGMADLVMAQRIYATREFSWSSYGTQKAVSLVVSAVSMGLSSLKDGAKGIALLAEGAASELVEQAGTKVVMNGKLLNVTIASAGKNLKSLAVKQIATSTLETGSRIVLKEAANGLADFSFEQVKDDIIRKVGDHISTRFRSTEMSNLLRYHWAINKTHLQLQMKAIVDGTVNPKATGWLQTWNNVGAPLCNGILASPQFLGSVYSRLTMISGMLLGSHEIITVIDRLCQEICSKLQEAKPSYAQLIQNGCGISKDTAERIAQQMKLQVSNTKHNGEQNEFHLEKLVRSGADISEKECRDVEDYFKRLKKSWSEFGFDDNIELSQTMKQIVDTVANHIIRTANSHLVSPVMSSCVGTIVAKISAELQDRFLTSVDESSDEQKQIKEKVETLKKKAEGETLTAEEKSYLKLHDVQVTFRSQIMGNAKAYTVAYQNRQIVAQAIQMKAKANADGALQDAGNCSTATIELCADAITDILVKKSPADRSIIFLLATLYDLDVKIVDDPNYVPTEAEIAAGTKIILCEEGIDGGVGHYSLMEPDGTLVSIEEGSGPMDCGYAVMAHLTNKSVDEMRLEAAEMIVSNPDQFSEIKDASNWVHERYPREANTMLGIGGKRKKYQTDQVEGAGDNEEEQNRRKRNKLKKRRRQGYTPTEEKGEGAGYVYVMRRKSDRKESNGENDIGHYKIGLSVNVDERKKELERRNNEEMEVLYVKRTVCRYTTEKLVHIRLEDYSKPREGVQGFTEWYYGSLSFFCEVVKNTRDDLLQSYNDQALLPEQHQDFPSSTTEDNESSEI